MAAEQINVWIPLGSFAISILLGLVAFLARRQIDRLEADVKAIKIANDIDLGKMRDDLRDLERQVDRECINGENLAEALAPLVKSLDKVGGDVTEIFRRLDGKQDKARRD